MIKKFVLPILIAMALTLAACDAIGTPPATQNTATPQNTATVQAEHTATPNSAPATVDPKLIAAATALAQTQAAPAPTNVPAATQISATSTPGNFAETFTYVPGGANYAWPDNGVEQLADGWTRIRTTANGQHPTWNFLVKVACDREIGEKLQWDSATKLEVYGPINCTIELKRDLESSKVLVPDPYSVANSKNSPLGLGWFVTGVGTVSANGVSIDLAGPGVKQFNFPKDWDGVWKITVTVPTSGVLTFNEGERITPNDNWPLP